MNYSTLYNEHGQYKALRDPNSLRRQCYEMEIAEWKLPNLLAILPSYFTPKSVVEVGCATGELIAKFPCNGSKVGVDISEENVKCARNRFPEIDFVDADINKIQLKADLVVLSDVVEHVPDDVDFLRSVGRCSNYVALHLPLEKALINLGRNYGPDDPAGHLRWYSFNDAKRIILEAGFEIVNMNILWFEEQSCYKQYLYLSRDVAHGGYRKIKRCVYDFVVAQRFLRRHVFPSHLFCFLRTKNER